MLSALGRVAVVEGPEITRALLMGVNAHLDDSSPAGGLRAGEYEPVRAAMLAHLSGGYA